MANPMFSLACLLLVLIYNADGTLRMAVNPTDFTPGLSESLTVNCSFSFAEISNISGIITMIVSKSDQQEQFIDLVSVNVFSPDAITTFSEVDGQVSGHMDPEHESFLSIVWTYPSVNVTGLYRCEMNGVDNHGHPSQLVQTSLVTSQQPNLEQLIDKIRQLQHQLASQDSQAKNQSEIILAQQSQLDNQSVTITDIQKQLQLLQSILFKPLCEFNISSEYNGHYYLLPEQKVNSTIAIATCKDYGGYLAQINNDNENQFVKGFIDQYTGFSFVLISGTDSQHEGQWTYTGTDTDLVFYDWGAGQPDSGQGGNCIFMPRSDQWRWWDYGCHNRERFLCELESV